MKGSKKVAIFTDCHGLLEPLEATLKDINKRGIDEIYSLGDNVGHGPNPKEVLNLLITHNVKSVAGNAEYYLTLGVAPFASYFDLTKLNSEIWTRDQLTNEHLDYLRSFPSSIELELGGKKISLCHFAGDVRTDWLVHGQSRYQKSVRKGNRGCEMFAFTNSPTQVEYLHKIIELYGEGPYAEAIVSQLKDPLFKGKRITEFDCVIEGHTHFEMPLERFDGTEIHTIRANGMGYRDDPIDSASYIILTEKETSFEVEKVLINFDREKMIESITRSDMPDKTIISKYVSMKNSSK